MAALVARGQTAELAVQMSTALDNGIQPAEISETITHSNVFSAIPVVKTVVDARPK